MGEDPLQEELGPARCTNRAYTCGSIVSAQVDRRSLERWLAANGFVLEPGKKTGHKHYSRQGIKIAIPGHGPQDLTKKHVALILRQLGRLGFDAAQVRRDLGS